MKLINSVLSAFCFFLLLSSCNEVEFKKTKSGVPYKVYPGKNGKAIKVGDMVKLHITQKIGDSVRMSTYERMPEYLKIDLPVAGYEIRENLMEVLPQVKTGDSLYFVQEIDSFIAKNPDLLKQDTAIKKGDKLITTVKIIEVFKSEQDAQPDIMKEQISAVKKMEPKQIEQFLKDTFVIAQMERERSVIDNYAKSNNMNGKRTALGTYVEIVDPGQGKNPDIGEYAMVRYRGKKLSGEEFDSNMDESKPAYPVQIGMGSSIKGFDDAIRQLKKGGKARIVIPSLLAYGPRGFPPKISPNEVLFFEIHVVDISATPPPQQMPLIPDSAGHN